MSTTLSDGATTVTLPAGLAWTDEFEWSPVQQAVEPSITGALIIQIGTQQSGRPITLQASEKEGWLNSPRTLVQQLHAWAKTPGQQLTLTRNGTAYTVIWRHHDAPPLVARPLGDIITDTPDHPHILTLKLMET